MTVPWLALAAALMLVQDVPADVPLPPPPDPQPWPAEPLPPPPSPAPENSGVRLVPYNADEVVSLAVSLGFASVVELDGDERAENIVVGNSGAWQVTANRQGNRIVVKPLADAMPTNMIVLTAGRRYMFMLYPGGGYGQAAFVTRFTYPEPDKTEPDAVVVSHYRFQGDKSLFPQAMYNDGRRTVVRWARQAALPATFAMGRGSKEELVNGRMEGDDYVIEGAAARYRFRLGDAEATAIHKEPRRRR